MSTLEKPQSSLHVHLISMHTSPLAQPGSGDAGGMNVYIDRSLRALLARYPQLSVEVFTLVTSPPSRSVEQISSRALVHFIYLPQAAGAHKNDLPAFVPDFARALAQAARRKPDLIHSHYWLSGMAALEYAPETPLVHTMHTTAAGKNARASADESPEPEIRLAGEQKIIDAVTALVVNTETEAADMVAYYGADPQKIRVITPGVDTGIFKPLPSQPPAHRGSSTQARLVFAGRPQPLKGPHLLVEALALLPRDLSVELVMIGKSGTGYEASLLERAEELGLSSEISLVDPLPPRGLAAQLRQADIVACPSSSETFGLVALEAQACGTPVLASKVDGLMSAVEDGATGHLVAPRTAGAWAEAIEALVRNPAERSRLGAAARERTLTMRWADTATALMELYREITKE